MRVLVAHPSEALRQRAWTVLDRLGWDVIEADDAADAVRLCEGEVPEVAVIESDLAWTGGGSLVEHFRQDDRLRAARLVVIENELDFEKAFAGLDAGADEYLVEPASDSEIAVRVQTAGRIGDLEARLSDQRSELTELVHMDQLTRLFNRRYLLRTIAAEVNAARRHGLPLSLLLIDLDNFKTINDTHGHAAGDEALRATSAILRARLRDTDIVGRWGGDEFLALLPNSTSDAAQLVASDLVSAVRDLAEFPELTLSVGCAVWSGDDPAHLVDRADTALYEVKRAGRDGVALAAEPSLEIAVPSPLQTVPNGRPLRVLLVDDVEAIRSLVRLTIEGPAIEIVGEASDGREAVALGRRLKPDVTVMDWNMPGMDGLQATRLMSAANRDNAIIAFTSTDETRIHRAMIEAGAVTHYNKNDLGDLAEHLLELQRALSAAA